MKKRKLLYSLCFILVCVIGVAAYKPSGDLITKDGRTSQSVVMGFTDTFAIHADFQNITAQTAFQLIDLSDTTNWKHSNTGHINLEYLIIEVDPNSSYVGEVKIGFLSDVTGTDGTFNQMLDIDMVRKADLLVEIINFGSHGFDCETDHLFGTSTVNNALFQTDVNLRGPDDAVSYPSGNGDLTMVIEASAGAVDVSATIGYETVE